MTEPQQFGASVSGAPSRSGWSTALWGFLALLAHAALLDAAVETFLSGSPLRWWIAPALVCFTVMSLWLWRPGGGWLSRYGPAVAAGTPVMILLGVLAGTAWLPGGQESGVRMFLQPTSRLLAGAVALAVLLAGYILVRGAAVVPARPRLVIRVVGATLALYAAAAFGLAIADNTAFAGVFQGGALWQRVPRWLQGSVVGALGLVPAAMLAQVLRTVGHLRRRQPVGVLINQTTALVLSLVMALSGTIVPGAAVPGGAAAGSATTAQPTGTPPQAVNELARIERARNELASLASRSAPGQPIEASQRVEGLKRVLKAAERTVAALPKDTFEPESVARHANGDPKALFEWVRDHTSWVPYRGSLRGPIGVLQDRVGNSVDRSLLLKRLLELSGRRTRLAHRTLSGGEARSMLAALPPMPARPALPGVEAAGAAIRDVQDQLAGDLGIEPNRLRTHADASEAAGADLVRRIDGMAGSLAGQLLRATGDGRVPAEEPGAAEAADHWWVQWEDGDRWVDMDLMAPLQNMGAASGPPSETFGSLPKAQRHTVSLEVVIEQASKERLASQTVLRRTLVPGDLLGRRVTLQHVPQKPAPAGSSLTSVWEFAGADQTWTPVLTIDSERYTDRGFSTAGVVVSAMGEASAKGLPAAPNLGGFLGGGGAEADPGDTWLTAEWLDYVIHVPGRPDRRVRRQVFDLLGPAARAARRLPTGPLPESARVERGLSLIGDTAILALPCFLSPTFVLWLNGRALLANQQLLLAVAGGGAESGGANLDRLLADATPFPGATYDLAVSRQAFETRGLTYVGSPNVVTYHRSLRRVSASEIATSEAFDVVANEVSARPGASGSPFETVLRQGVIDTILEAYSLPEGCCGGGSVANAATAMASSDTPWVVVRDAAGVERLGLDADLRTRIAADVADGYVVLAPTVSAGPGAWWRIDPRSGTTIGMGDRGWGQGALEYAGKLIVRIGLITMCVLNANRIQNETKRDVVKVGCALAGFFSFMGAMFRVSLLALAGDVFSLGFNILGYNWTPS